MVDYATESNKFRRNVNQLNRVEPMSNLNPKNVPHNPHQNGRSLSDIMNRELK
jgi:hypothetical protein